MYMLSLSFRIAILLRFPLVILEISNHQNELNWCLFSRSTFIFIAGLRSGFLCGLARHGIAYLILLVAYPPRPHHTDCTTVSCYLVFCLIAYQNLVLIIVTFLCRFRGKRVVGNIHSKFHVPVEVGQIHTYVDLPY